MVKGLGDAPAIVLDTTTGWLEGAARVVSPNWDPRPAGCDVELVVVHGISLPPGRYGGGYVDALFTNTLDPREDRFFQEIEGLRVSAHLLIDRRGGLTQYVPLHGRAWHAGPSRFRGRSACNDFSVGIELEGSDDDPYEDIQYTRLAAVIREIRRHWPAIGRDEVVGHCDIAPGRKTDPGPAFDWRRLHRLVAWADL